MAIRKPLLPGPLVENKLRSPVGSAVELDQSFELQRPILPWIDLSDDPAIVVQPLCIEIKSTYGFAPEFEILRRRHVCKIVRAARLAIDPLENIRLNQLSSMPKLSELEILTYRLQSRRVLLDKGCVSGTAAQRLNSHASGSGE